MLASDHPVFPLGLLLRLVFHTYCHVEQRGYRVVVVVWLCLWLMVSDQKNKRAGPTRGELSQIVTAPLGIRARNPALFFPFFYLPLPAVARKSPREK